MLNTRVGSRLAVLVPTVAAAAIGLSACGGGSKSPAASTATTTTAGSATTAGSPTTAGSGGGSNQLTQLANEMNSGLNTTFKATYSGTSGGQTQTVTLEQAPPNSLFSSGTGEVISNSSKTYFCSTSGQETCVVESGPNPLAGLLSLYSPKTYISDLQAAQASAHGSNLSFSTKTIAGQSSNCVTVTGVASNGTYCVTSSGILASVSSGSDSFTLTSYTTNVPASDFRIPSGASTQSIPQVTLPPGVTLPSGVTIP